MSAQRPLLVEVPIHVKTYEVDFARIVHNIVYLRWLEDLRTLILEETVPLASMLNDGVTPILTHTDIHYQWPLRLGDVATGRMWVTELHRTRWTLRGEIFIGAQVVATAEQRGYFASLETLRPVRVPEQLRRLWEAARADA